MTTTTPVDINNAITNSNNANGGTPSNISCGGGVDGGGGNLAGVGVIGIDNTSNNATLSSNIPNAVAINGAANNTTQRAGDTNTKRKKFKSRSGGASLPSGSSGGGGNYAKDHLDAWLENCLRDASNAQLSSSSEFLDFNPTSNRGSGGGLFMPTQQQQQQQQQNMPVPQQQQQQQQQSQSQPQQQPQYQMPNLHNFNMQQQQQHMMSSQQQQQQQFLLRSNSSPYGGGGGLSSSGNVGNGGGSYSAPFSLGIQRNTPSYLKNSNSLNNRFPMLFSMGTNGGGMMPGSIGGLGYYGHNDASQDFASLPPIVNMFGGGGGGGGGGGIGGLGNNSEHEQNSTDVLDGSGSNPHINRGFSDPCLLNPSDNDSKLSGQNTPDRRQTMQGTDMENNKFFVALMEQINILHETNSKICRNLHETKVDIEALKHPPSTWGGGGGIGMRHRRDSLSGLSTQSQPMVFGGGFGTHSPAPTFHSAAYAPGMMTDVVREVKEAARVREDALINRVKSMVEERQWSMNEGNVRILRDIDELKTHVLHLRLERKEINKRLNHLEAENRYMRQLVATLYNNRNASDIIYENETLRTRKPFAAAASAAHTRRSQSFNLHYGTIHQQSSALGNPSLALDEDGVGGGGGGESPAQQNADETLTEIASNARTSFSSTDSCIGNSSQSQAKQSVQSPPNFALVSPEDKQQITKQYKKESSSTSATAAAAAVSRVKQQQQEQKQLMINNEKDRIIEEDKEQLKRELDEAVAARKQADQRIIALEKLVSSLAVGGGQRNYEQYDLLVHHPSNNITNGLVGEGEGLVHTSSYGASTTTTNTTNAVAAPSQWLNYHYNHSNNSSTSSPFNIKQANQMNTTSNNINNNNNSTNTTTTVHHHMATSSMSIDTSTSSPKLSVAGPITDL